MAMPKKGARSIVVEGQRYRWSVRHKPSFSQGSGWTNLTAAVELAAEPGATLVVDFGDARLDAWMGLPKASAVAPSELARCIRAALISGWEPSSPGKPFQFHINPLPDKI